MIYWQWYKMCRFIFMLALVMPVWLAWMNGGVMCDGGDVVEIDIESGRIRGKRSLTLFGEKPYYSFRGIPYAKPPIKDLRFKVSLFCVCMPALPALPSLSPLPSPMPLSPPFMQICILCMKVCVCV